MRPTPDYIAECLEFDGRHLRWRLRPESHYRTKGAWKHHRSRDAGKIAGHVHRNNRRVEIDGKGYAASHLSWVLAHGEWPEGELVPVNGDGLDIRPENLRDVSPADRRVCRRDTRVTINEQSPGRYTAYYAGKGLGTYGTREEAENAVTAAREARRAEILGAT